MLALSASALSCALESDPHAGHAAHGTASGAVCPEDSELDYASFGAAFLTRYCVHCHASTLSASEREGAPFGADYDSRDRLIASGIVHVDYVAGAGPDGQNDFMPPRTFAAQPTWQEREALGQWLACGAP